MRTDKPTIARMRCLFVLNITFNICFNIVFGIKKVSVFKDSRAITVETFMVKSGNIYGQWWSRLWYEGGNVYGQKWKHLWLNFKKVEKGIDKFHYM